MDTKKSGDVSYNIKPDKYHAPEKKTHRNEQNFDTWKNVFTQCSSLEDLIKMLWEMPIQECPIQSYEFIKNVLLVLKTEKGTRVHDEQNTISFEISENEAFNLSMSEYHLNAQIVLALNRNIARWISTIPDHLRKDYEPLMSILTRYSYGEVQKYIESQNQPQAYDELMAMVEEALAHSSTHLVEQTFEYQGYTAKVTDHREPSKDKKDDKERDTFEDFSGQSYTVEIFDPQGVHVQTSEVDFDPLDYARKDMHGWAAEESDADRIDEDGFGELIMLKKCLENYAELGQAQDLELFFEILDTLAASYITKDLGLLFTKINPDESFNKIVQLVRSASTPDRRAKYARVLSILVEHRIEITQGQFQYGVETMTFKDGDEEGYLKRISRDGKLAVFDNHEELKGFVQPKEGEAELEQITPEMVESGRNQIRDEDIKEFCKNYTTFFNETCSGLTGINLSALTLREQFGLYTFWKKTQKKTGNANKKWDKLWDMMNLFGVNALKVTLGMEYDADLPEKARGFAFDRNIPRDIKALVFQQYGKIIERLDRIEEDAAQFFKGALTDGSFHAITQQLSERAYKILVASIDASKEGNPDTLIKKINSIEEEVVLFSSFFSGLFKGKETVNFEDIKGLDFSLQQLGELSDETKEEMKRIAHENWKSRGKAGKEIVGEFEQTLESDRDIRFYTLYKDQKLIAFVRFEPVRDSTGNPIEGRTYAGSFNVEPRYRGGAIGEAMLSRSLDLESEHAVIEATVSPRLIVGTDYVEKRGFVIDQVLPNYDGSGETFFSIKLDRALNKELYTKKITPEDKKRFALEALFHEVQPVESLLVKDDEIVRRYDINSEAEFDKMIQDVEFLTKHGCVGSRYYYNPETPATRTLVFEKIEKKDKKDTKRPQSQNRGIRYFFTH